LRFPIPVRRGSSHPDICERLRIVNHHNAFVPAAAAFQWLQSRYQHARAASRVLTRGESGEPPPATTGYKMRRIFYTGFMLGAPVGRSGGCRPRGESYVPRSGLAVKLSGEASRTGDGSRDRCTGRGWTSRTRSPGGIPPAPSNSPATTTGRSSNASIPRPGPRNSGETDPRFAAMLSAWLGANVGVGSGLDRKG
jgi:hypothetical protein